MSHPTTHRARTSPHHGVHHHAAKHHEAPAYVRAFIEEHLADAQAIQRKYGVPAGVVLAQSAPESSWGRAVVSNAYFGVKGHAPSGDSTTFTTHEVIKGKAITIKAPFRAYGSYQDAADDYANMLSNNPRFRTCFLHTSSSQFAVSLARNGYATDPIYAHKLNSIIRAHKLDQYDAKGAHQ